MPTATPAPQSPASPEEIWAIIRETQLLHREIAERQRETDRQMQETDRRLQETDRIVKETDRILRETVRAVDKSHAQIGGLHNSFGELAEHLVAPGIIERFGELGYRFDGMASQYKIPGKREGSISAEVDLLLENADTVIAVEIKARPSHDKTRDDIAHHVRRLEKLRNTANAGESQPSEFWGR